MKKHRITITHQLEKTKHVFYVTNPEKLSRNEVERIVKSMGVEVLFVNGRLYRG